MVAPHHRPLSPKSPWAVSQRKMMTSLLFVAVAVVVAVPASINPVQNGTTFVACDSYGSGDGGKTCLRQGIPYVSTPDCDSQGGVNLQLPVRHMPPFPPAAHHHSAARPRPPRSAPPMPS